MPVRVSSLNIVDDYTRGAPGAIEEAGIFMFQKELFLELEWHRIGVTCFIAVYANANRDDKTVAEANQTRG